MPRDNLTAIFSQHTIHLQRIAAAQGRAVIPYLEKIEMDTQRVFNKYRDRAKTPANEIAIQKAIKEITRENLQAYIKEVKKDGREVGSYEADFAASTLTNNIDSDIKPVSPATATVSAAAIKTPIKLGEASYSTYSMLMANYWKKWSNEVDSLVKNSFVNGSNINDISEDVFKQLKLERGLTGKNVLSRAKRSAKSIAITSVNHHANTARVAFANENSDLVKGYRLISVLDSKTSQKCRALDQKLIASDSKDLSRYTPPLHINCRTALVYEVDDKYKLDTADRKRASSFEVDGKRDPKKTTSEGIYYDKLAGLGKDDQDAVLGRTLGKAFRKLDNPKAFAKATIDSLGNPLTIKEMKEEKNKLGAILRKQQK